MTTRPALLGFDDVTSALVGLPGVERGVSGTLVLGLRAPSPADARRLVATLLGDAGRTGHHPALDVRGRDVVLMFRTEETADGPPGITAADVELAGLALAAAAATGAVVTPVPPRIEIALDAVDVERVRAFWAAALGYREVPSHHRGPELHDPAGRGPVLWFQRMDPPRHERSRFHLDVYAAPDEIERRTAGCLAAGGRVLDDAADPRWWVLADVEGNEVCLSLEPDPVLTDGAAG